jgi:hypothetical protein
MEDGILPGHMPGQKPRNAVSSTPPQPRVSTLGCGGPRISSGDMPGQKPRNAVSSTPPQPRVSTLGCERPRISSGHTLGQKPRNAASSTPPQPRVSTLGCERPCISSGLQPKPYFFSGINTTLMKLSSLKYFCAAALVLSTVMVLSRRSCSKTSFRSSPRKVLSSR